MPYSSKAKAKEYHQQYHLRTWEKRKLKQLELKRIRREKLSLWLKFLKKDLFCIKCGENHPACLDFHHKDGNEKEATVSDMISQGYSIKTINVEIGKCIVLCRNCHAKEHYDLLQSLRLKIQQT